MTHAFFDIRRPVVLGHRGAAAHAPENTLVGFARGLELGADIIETDVHATRDGVPVLLHDASVDRTTDGQGAIAELSLAEVEQLDAGYAFEQERKHPFRSRGVRIPTLAEAFRTFPGVRFNLEIKAPGPEIAQEVLRLIAEFDRAPLTLVTAGENPVMAQLREALAKAPVVPAVGACLADIVAVIRAAQDGAAPPDAAMALQIPTDFGGRPLVTRELVAHAHEHDIQIHVWTINEPDEMNRLLDLGVDGLVTDYPDRARRIADERRDRD